MTGRDMNDQQLDEQMMNQMRQRITEHLQVMDEEGAHVGIVDKLEGDRIKLIKNDTNSDGQHHYVSLDQVASVDDVAVRLNGRLDDIRKNWQNQ
ncbi:DUF2171 domain-containing protein [Deinococcus pimensis]|uniref:DUF2171 domain-containing protein n=1 Tax=Deinococcus pimensis TaxID=309888 RepID=UPI0004B185E2|nr:DUF2171 domain-containing protein [Deinococcus pimensis]